MLENKTGIVFGVANQRSLAWSITESLASAGAELAVTYQDTRFEKKIKKMAGESLEKEPLTILCDVTDEKQVDRLTQTLENSFGKLDFMVHSIAFAGKEELEGAFINTSRDGFLKAMEISAYSLVSLSRALLPLLKEGGSIVTLTYLGSSRVIPNYNVMGVAKAALEAIVRYLASDLGPRRIRVNALSPGPVNTLSARGIKGFTGFLEQVDQKTALGQNISGREVGDTALFLCSDLSRGITGEVIYVDAGYNIMGL